jgi:hypothetical protein
VAAVCLGDCLQSAALQLLAYLDCVARNGDRVLQLRAILASATAPPLCFGSWLSPKAMGP